MRNDRMANDVSANKRDIEILKRDYAALRQDFTALQEQLWTAAAVVQAGHVDEVPSKYAVRPDFQVHVPLSRVGASSTGWLPSIPNEWNSWSRQTTPPQQTPGQQEMPAPDPSHVRLIGLRPALRDSVLIPSR